MKKTKFIFIIIFITLFNISCKKTEEQPAGKDISLAKILVKSELVVGVDVFHPPLSYTNSMGKVIGFDIDVLTAVAERLGIGINFIPIEWNKKLTLLDDENIDCLAGGFSLVEERKVLYETTSPYFKNAYIVLVKTKSPYYTIADLKGQAIGGLKDSVGINTINNNSSLRKNFTFVYGYPSTLHAIQAINEKKIEAAIADISTISKILNDYPDEFRILEEGLAIDFFVYGFKRGSVTLKNEIEKKLIELEADGTLEKISRKYFNTDVVIIGK